MKKTGRLKFKKGAASFYVVAFSTLVLVIIAASFAAVAVSPRSGAALWRTYWIYPSISRQQKKAPATAEPCWLW